LFFSILSVSVTARLAVGRFLTSAIALDRFEYVDLIEQECQGIGSSDNLHQSFLILATFSIVFFALFMFDTLGDSVGYHRAYWVLLAMSIAPIVLYVCRYIRVWCMKRAALGVDHNVHIDMRSSSMLGWGTSLANDGMESAAGGENEKQGDIELFSTKNVLQTKSKACDANAV
jgi:hypothetical protein